AGVWDRYYVFRSQSKALSEAQVVSALGKENVESIEPDYYVEWFSWPDDALFDQQWYLNNTGQAYLGIDRREGYYNDTLAVKTGVAGEDIGISPLYDSPPADVTRVVVAILDTGVDVLHPELEGSIWRNPDEIAGNGIDDDHNGLVDDTLGWDISGDTADVFNPQPDNDPSDEIGHGTHIAGIVASRADEQGIVGVAPDAVIMPIKMFPNGTASIGAAGIVYAVSSGAKVINISWGSPFQSAILEDALRFARRNGVFVAIATGNTGRDEDMYPAASDSTFGVGAANAEGEVTYFSTFGDQVDIVAPGRDILSLRASGTDMYADGLEPEVRIIGPDSLYYLSDGTSMAAPMVAAAAARIWSIRPDIPLEMLEDILRWGARDILDPLDEGLELPGPDSISGWGFLDLNAALQMAGEGGVFVVEPVRRNRYTEDVPIRIAPVAGYSGGWTLSIATDQDPEWQQVASAVSFPADSVAYVFTEDDPQGNVRLRLTDDLGGEHITSFVHVRSRRVEITGPVAGEEVRYNVNVSAYCYGPLYDSVTLSVGKTTGTPERVFASTGEFFDSLLYTWSASGTDTGLVQISLTAYFEGETEGDTTTVNVLSTFSAGFPQPLVGRGGVTPAVSDLDNDGKKEVVVGTSAGVQVWTVTGTDAVPTPGFPAGAGDNFQGVPAIYDIDRDGFKEIIACNDFGINAFNHDGTPVEGWPVACTTGVLPYGYGYPTPVIVKLGQQRDSAIMIVNKLGQILAYQFDGNPYFFSLEGEFATFNSRMSRSWLHGGSSAMISSADDLDGDGNNEVVAEFTSGPPYYGLAVFDGRTGQPKFHETDPIVQRVNQSYGFTLADLDQDGLSEVIGVGYDEDFSPSLYVKTKGNIDFPGWPRAIPERTDYVASYPVVRDLNLDGIPEILITFFEFDIAALYIFEADGSPYVERQGRPEGEALTVGVTLSTPTVANLVGDEYPEIAIRSGYILPGTGKEKLYLLDHTGQPVPGWPIETPAPRTVVLSSRQVPLVDDIDGDGLVELALVSDGTQLLVWDYDASVAGGTNTARFLHDNRNSSILPTLPAGDSQQITVTSGQLAISPSEPIRLLSWQLVSPDTLELVYQMAQEGDVAISALDTTGTAILHHPAVAKRRGQNVFKVPVPENVDGKLTIRNRQGRTMVSNRLEVR
ncbi:S8 family serine peptidase, partial [candidate division GN15 bacterium]|nr:S8 family serine peptidase [candidate division GN15 bacterium]